MVVSRLEEILRTAVERPDETLPDSVLATVQARLRGLEPEERRNPQVATDYAGDGIVCNAVAPGKILTGMGGYEPTETQLAYSRSRTPWPSRGQAGDVASAALFLASPEATYITGENLMVDGGWMAG